MLDPVQIWQCLDDLLCMNEIVIGITSMLSENSVEMRLWFPFPLRPLHVRDFDRMS
jgi:hypothetical protein